MQPSSSATSLVNNSQPANVAVSKSTANAQTPVSAVMSSENVSHVATTTSASEPVQTNQAGTNTAGTQSTQATKNDTLPQTGNNQSKLGILGMAVASALAMLGLADNKRQHD